MNAGLLQLDALVHEMTSLLRTAIPKKADVQFDLESAPVEGDEAQLRQVILNLVTNASEALEENVGKIQLQTGVCMADATNLSLDISQNCYPAVPMPLSK